MPISFLLYTLLALSISSLRSAEDWQVIDLPEAKEFCFEVKCISKEECDSLTSDSVAYWSTPKTMPKNCCQYSDWGQLRRRIEVRIFYDNVWQTITATMSNANSYEDGREGYIAMHQHKNPKITELKDGVKSERCRVQNDVEMYGYMWFRPVDVESNPDEKCKLYRLKAVIDWYRDTHLKKECKKEGG